MNNQFVIKGLELQSNGITVKLEELSISVDMDAENTSRYMSVLQSLMDLIKSEVTGNKTESQTLQEILSGN